VPAGYEEYAEDYGRIADYVDSQRETYAGMRIEWDGDQLLGLVVYFSGDEDRHEAVLRAMVDHREMLTVKRARLSRVVAVGLCGELLPVVTDLVAPERRPGGSGRSFMIHPDPPGGVKITLPTGYEDAQRVLLRHYGDQVQVTLADIRGFSASGSGGYGIRAPIAGAALKHSACGTSLE
jgi:hypothetical protein